MSWWRRWLGRLRDQVRPPEIPVTVQPRAMFAEVAECLGVSTEQVLGALCSEHDISVTWFNSDGWHASLLRPGRDGILREASRIT